MHYPADATCLPFPLNITPWAVASFVAMEDELRATFGEPHFIEDDTVDHWAWELPDGQRLCIALDAPYDYVIVYCDPPDPSRAITALGLSPDGDALKVFPEPLLIGPRG